MRYQYFILWMCTALLLPAFAQAQSAGDDSRPAPRELWKLDATDGRSHQIEGIAIVGAGNAETLYVVEGAHDVLPAGSTDPVDGEYLLWTLDTNGRVKNSELIAKRPFPWHPSRAMIVPRSAPAEGGLLVGMFEDESTGTPATNAYSLLHVDDAGRIVKSEYLTGPSDAFRAAVLLPDGEGVLLAGEAGFGGCVWKVDLEGKTIWRKEFLSKTDMSDADFNQRVAAQFGGIALADDQGGFIVVGQFGGINKFGAGPKSIWLVRCDADGRILSEKSLPGRLPAICAPANELFAVLSDNAAAFEVDCRLLGVDLHLEQLWEEKVPVTAFFVDGPRICPIPSRGGFVVAGCDIRKPAGAETGQWGCSVLQYDNRGHIVSAVRIPVARETVVNARVTCGVDCAYVALQTKGMGPNDAKEAAVFEIPLKPQK